MAKKEKETKPKKVLFSEEIDSAINGFAVGFLFIGIGLFLLLKPDYFTVPMVSYIIGAIVGLFGVAGTGVELSHATKIKGMDSFSLGAVAFIGWLVQYIYIGRLWSNILFFALLIFGGYGLLLGLFQAIYSIIHNVKQQSITPENGANGKVSVGKLLSQIVLFLTQLCGLAVAVLNVLKASAL